MTELIPVNQEERFYLVKYERARQALAEASSIDEIKAVHDFSIRMRLYARQSNNRNMAADAIVLQARAEREIGLLMRAQRDTFGLSLRGPQRVLSQRGAGAALNADPACPANAALAESPRPARGRPAARSPLAHV